MNVGETPTQGRICAILQGSDAIGEQPPMLTDIFAVRRNPRACLRHFGVSKLKRGNLENQDIVFICPARCLHCSAQGVALPPGDRKSTRLNSSHVAISYAVFCLKKKRLSE